ncbi:hypothetical protein Btru_005649 [Bulinus truncatus]|nr:hypothetical protein Btru_005649 [Bulinus truncatus]
MFLISIGVVTFNKRIGLFYFCSGIGVVTFNKRIGLFYFCSGIGVVTFNKRIGIGVVTFNKRIGLFDENPDQDSVEFLKATRRVIQIVQDSIFGKLILYKWYGNPTYKRFEDASRVIDRVTAKHVTSAKKILEKRIESGQFSEDEPNFLFSLLSEKSLSDDDVANIMSGLFFAGTDSTAKYLQVYLYNLAKNPEKQEILRQEILENLGTSGPLTADALSKMTYLKAALKESFRLNYPTPSGVVRILQEDVTLGQYLVPAGTRIMMFNLRPAQTHFKDPDQYLPERWLRSEDNDKKDAAHNMIVLPFGVGPRNCIGRRFAVQEIYLAASKLLQHFKIEIEPENMSVKFIYKLFIESEQPIRFKFTKINQ